MDYDISKFFTDKVTGYDGARDLLSEEEDAIERWYQQQLIRNEQLRSAQEEYKEATKTPSTQILSDIFDKFQLATAAAIPNKYATAGGIFHNALPDNTDWMRAIRDNKAMDEMRFAKKRENALDEYNQFTQWLEAESATSRSKLNDFNDLRSRKADLLLNEDQTKYNRASKERDFIAAQDRADQEFTYRADRNKVADDRARYSEPTWVASGGKQVAAVYDQDARKFINLNTGEIIEDARPIPAKTEPKYFERPDGVYAIDAAGNSTKLVGVPGKPDKEMKLSDTQVGVINSFDETLASLDSIEEYKKKHEVDTGPLAAPWSAINQKLGTSDYIPGQDHATYLKAQQGAGMSAYQKALSGLTVGEKEMERLLGQFPQFNDNDKTFAMKLAAMRDQVLKQRATALDNWAKLGKDVSAFKYEPTTKKKTQEVKFKSKEEVGEAYRSGKITRMEAMEQYRLLTGGMR